MLVVNSHLSIPLSEFEFTFARSSGPGGQNVNKVNSKAMLRWRALESPSLTGKIRERFLTRYGNRLTVDGDMIITSQRYRDQGRNVADCTEKLRAMLAEITVAPKRRRPTRPTKAAVERRIESKKKGTQKKRLRRPVERE
jgi:ribosome-associated protein